MTTYSKILNLVSGVARTIDLSNTSNVLGVANLELLGSTSGHLLQTASATTTSYTIVWPDSQGAASTFLQNDGSGNLSWSPISSSPAISNTFVAGQSFSANTSYVVRWGMNALSETTNRVYAADYDTSSCDEFWALGIAMSTSGVTAGQNIQVYSFGTYTLGSSDTPFNTVNIGAPVWLTSAGAFSVTAPTGTSEADLKIGIIMSTTSIWLDGQVTGIGNANGGVPIYPLEVAAGGTGLNSLTPYAVICGGTGSTTAMQQVSGLGTSGYVLTSNGASALPTWQPGGTSLTFSDSLVNNSGTVTLVNDSASPTASQYYGTNGSSTLGYYNLPVSGINQLTGDVTAGPGTGSQVATLATVNSDTGSFGSSTSIPSFTVNAKGLITAASGNAVVAPAGTLSGTTLNSTVVSSSLTSLGIQAQALNMGSNQINDLASPSASTDAATKGYVDAAISGLTWKGPVQAYSNVNVPLTGSTPLVIDGHTVVNNDLLLLGNQTTASQNGEYTAAITGGSYTLTANGNPTAAGDAWLVLDGTVYANSAFVATAAVPAAEFVEFAGPTALIFTSPLVLTGNTVTINQATTSTNGYLSSTDWNTFNNKQPAGSYITALTGDATASGPGSAALTLATVNSNVGSYTNASITVNAKGLITAASSGSSSPLTTKGDTFVYSTTNTRQPVPGDYGQLIADSTQTTGWRDATYTMTDGKPGKNYIQYADFENNSTTGWTLGTIGTLTNGLPTGSPTFGSGASGNLSIAATSSSIEGVYSLNYVSSAATTQGNMVASSSYAIDAEDQAKVLTVKFYYKAASGASNCNFSGTSSNSFAWALYDVTNSSWLSSAGNFNLIQNSGCGYVTGTCQTNATTANIRLCVYNANATSGAATITLDGFYVGPQTAPSGPAMGDWSTTYSFTPSAGLGSVTNAKYLTRRNGDSLEYMISLQNGTVTSTTASFGMPSGLAIDSTKLASSTIYSKIGDGQTVGSSTEGAFVAGVGLVAFYDGSDTANIYVGYQVAGGTTPLYSKVATNSLFSTGYPMFISGRIPIAGWSSNSVQSSDTDTRVVAAKYFQDGSTPSVSTSAPMQFNTLSYDTHGAVTTGSSWKFTAPVSGYYNVRGSFDCGSSSRSIYLYKNGSLDSTIGEVINANSQCVFAGQTKLNAGDYIDVRADSCTQVGITSLYIAIERLSGPAVIAATEVVAATIEGAANSSTVSANTPILFNTKIQDTHNAYNTSTGQYTVPLTGFYQVTGGVNLASGGAGAYNIYINGSIQAQAGYTSSSAVVFSAGVYVTAGQTIDVRCNNSMTFTGSSNGQAQYAYLSIIRAGRGN